MIKDPGSTRIAIVGVGNVGATYAYSLLLSGLAGEIVLIDNNQAKTSGEAMDLNHAVPSPNPPVFGQENTKILPGLPLRSSPQVRHKRQAKRGLTWYSVTLPSSNPSSPRWCITTPTAYS